MALDFVQQLVGVLAFFAGLACGEFVVSRAFGRPRGMLVIAEVFVFAVAIVVLSTGVFFTVTDFSTHLLLSFATAFVIAVAARAVSTGVGAVAVAVQKPVLGGYSREEKLLIAAAETMAEQGIREEEIKKALESAGFQQKVVDRIFASHGFETKPHPLLREVARLEQEIAALKKRRGRR